MPRRPERQPEYSASEIKMRAREKNVEIYRRLTGLYCIPEDKQYWTLCHLQPPVPGSEIIQLESMGFLKKSQFYGVDWDKKKEDIILQNQQWHPDAHWIEGEWTRVLTRTTTFNPALVFLDITRFADKKRTADVVVPTMYKCPLRTVLIVNLLLSNPRGKQRFNPDKLVEYLCTKVGSLELKHWLTNVERFWYNAFGRTDMITFVFYKKGAQA